MAELYQSIKDPKELVKILKGVPPPEENSDTDSINEEPAPKDVIDNIYQSMSQIIEVLNTDNLLLNNQVKKFKQDQEFIYQTITIIKTDNEEMINTYSAEMSSVMEQLAQFREKLEKMTSDDNLQAISIIDELKKQLDFLNVEILRKTDRTADLQKQILDVRSMLLKTMHLNIQNLKKEMDSLRDLRPHIKSIVAEEVEKYMAGMPSLESKFEKLEREYKSSIARHARKSTMQKSQSNINMGDLVSVVQDQVKIVDCREEICQIKAQQDAIQNKQKEILQMLELINVVDVNK